MVESPSPTELPPSVKDGKIGDCVRRNERCSYRSQLEEEIQAMQKQLQEEININLALSNIIQQNTSEKFKYHHHLPDEIRQLLSVILALEINVCKLEEDLISMLLPDKPSSSSVMEIDDGLSPDFQDPNRISEEMVRCMRSIFIHLSQTEFESSNHSSKECILSSPAVFLSSSSLSDSSLDVESQHVCCENKLNPYRVHWNKTKILIGVYSSATEVSWLTVGKNQLEYASGALKKIRLLVKKLEKVDPSIMSFNHRLAFWINIYNSLIMHAYLAYGVPRNEVKLFSLMQKASYVIGGQSISAAEIEYVILKMRPPLHRPKALIKALIKLKKEHNFSFETPQPLAIFALSCGMHSSPAVRILTPKNISSELQNSLKDYIQASVCVSNKGKLLIPKLVHYFAKETVEDSLMVDWICRFLSQEQVSAIGKSSSSQRKYRASGARSFNILTFDSRFRYLFLPDDY